MKQSVIEEDHRLEGTASSASEALAAHRWHWTLDESNPERVSVNAYASSVGRARSVIAKHVHGYAAWAVSATRPLSEEIERASMSVEKEAAVEAIAEARGLTFRAVRHTLPKEIRDLRNAARDAAERKGTSVIDEVGPLAEAIVKSEHSQRQQEVGAKERHPLRWVKADGHLSDAKQSLRLAQKEMADVLFDDEERDLLHIDLEQIIGIAHLIDQQVSGTAVLDWEVELTKIMEGATS